MTKPIGAAVPPALVMEKPKCAVELTGAGRAQSRRSFSFLVNLAGEAVKAARRIPALAWKCRPLAVRTRSKNGALSQSGLCV
jgi:hypothetical protein